MKWKWETREQKLKARRERMAQWHRLYPIFRIIRDHENQTSYWLQPVWRRALEFKGTSPYYNDYLQVTRWEYREGNEAPEVKACPPAVTPTIV